MLSKSLQGATSSGVNPNAWDVSHAYYDAGSKAWDLSAAHYVNINAGVSAQEITPTGVFFKQDGTKMYVVGSTSDAVQEYNLSGPWVVNTYTFSQSFSVSTQDTSPQDIFFTPDGTKMYMLGSTGIDVNEYSLSTAWNISTASYVRNFSISAQGTSPEALFFKTDGTKMYCVDTGSINEYSLSTAWDISTASYTQNFSTAAQDTGPTGVSFRNDGTKMYIVGIGTDAVYEYNLSTAWSVSTATYVQNFSVAAQATTPYGVYFKPDGSGFYVIDATADSVYQYVIGAFSVAAQDANPNDIFFKPDGTKMYVVGSTSDNVYEYNLSTAWDIHTASYLQAFNVTSQEPTAQGLFFKPDGTAMYVTGSVNDRVNQYSLSTAWNVSTASFVQNFSVSAQEANASGLFFKPDGTKMYVIGTSGDTVFEYSLSTAWDISTASNTSNFSVSAQEVTPTGVFFKPDGTKMYVIGSNGDDVNEYSLSTAWVISTATFIHTFSVGSTLPGGIFFKDDGTQFFVVDANIDRVSSYLISGV